MRKLFPFTWPETTEDDIANRTTTEPVAIKAITRLRFAGSEYQVVVATDEGSRTIHLTRILDQVVVLEASPPVVVLTSTDGQRYVVRLTDDLDRRSRNILYFIT